MVLALLHCCCCWIMVLALLLPLLLIRRGRTWRQAVFMWALLARTLFLRRTYPAPHTPRQTAWHPWLL